MVEAPGTAPGSTTLISRTVYRHSWRTSEPNIGKAAPWGKGARYRPGCAWVTCGVRSRLTHWALPRTLRKRVENA
jgi:hypothetical protein